MAFGPKNPWQQFATRLERAEVISKRDWHELDRRAKQEHSSVVDMLYDDGRVSEATILEHLGEHFASPTVLLRTKVISPYVLNLVPKEVAERHNLVVFKKTGQVIHVAVTDPTDQQSIDFVRRHTQLDPEVFLTTPTDIRQALQRYQTDLSQEFQNIIDDGLRDAETSQGSAEDLANHIPIVTMVDSLLHRAVTQHASDIHLEPNVDDVIIRFRIDGLLKKIVTVPKALHAPLVARIKLMAGLKIDEHRVPQDGRLSLTINDHPIAVRVAVIPTLNGSKIALRILDEKRQLLSLKALGLQPADYATVKEQILKPTGMLIITGPTGSGKTTTLYTLLNLLNAETVNICTVEDPIEYGLPGVNQTQINPAAGLTFATGLRSLLRQDPNVIMVGEIRDMDTADIAVNAAMTGHLVLTTLHANSAAQTVQRLVEMGVQPYLAASTINLIVAQRLVRHVCPHCQRALKLTEKALASYRQLLGLDEVLPRLHRLGYLAVDDILTTVRAGRGCAKCQQTGYLGRLGLYELLTNSDGVHGTMLQGADPKRITAAARADGHLSMIDDGVIKVLNGLTTFDEVVRVTR